MKIFSLPILICFGGAAVVAGGLLYATSGYTYTPPKKIAATSDEAGPSQVTPTDGTPSSTDNSLPPASGSTAMSGDSANNGWGQGQQGYQGNRGTPEEREQRRQQRMQQMAAALGLTDAQKAQMEEIRKTITDRTQRRAAIMAILTPDQQAKLEQMRTQGGGRRERGGNGGAPGGNGASASTAPAGGASPTPPKTGP